MALSKDAKNRLDHAVTSEVAGQEVANAIDASTSANVVNAASAAANALKVAGSNFIIAGILIATNTDNTDAATLAFLVDDVVALIKDADQTLQTITSDDEFAVAPAVGDLILHLRAV